MPESDIITVWIKAIDKFTPVVKRAMWAIEELFGSWKASESEEHADWYVSLPP